MKGWSSLSVRNRILIVVGVVLIVVTIAAVVFAVSQPEIRTAVVLLVEGLVEVRTGGAEGFIAALVDMLLSSGDEMRTGEDGRSVLELDSGMVVVVAPNSVFYVEEMAGEPENAITRFILNAGEVFSISSETLPEGAGYEVETPVGIIGIRGSAMSASYDPATGSVEATCLTGACAVRTDTAEVDLTGNQAITVTEAAGIVVGPVPLTSDQLGRWNAALEVAERAGVGDAFSDQCQCEWPNLVCDDGASYPMYVGCWEIAPGSYVTPCEWYDGGVGMCIVMPDREPVRILEDFDVGRFQAVAMSPDAGQIAFAVVPAGGGEVTLYVADADGTDPRALPRPGNNISPSWSPDGEWLAFSSDGSLALMHPDGTEPQVILATSETGPCIDVPQWSPDSQSVAVRVWPDQECSGEPAYPLVTEMWVVSLDGEIVVPVVSFTVEEGDSCAPWTNVAFSPDGTQVAYTDGACDVWLVSADGSGAPEALEEFPWTWWGDSYPQWYAPEE